MRKGTGAIQLIFVLAFAIVIAVVIASLIPAYSPIVSATAKISPDNIKNSGQAVLTVNLNNNDKSNAHNIELRFVTYSLVHVFIGNTELTHEGEEGNFVYDLTLQASQKIEQPFYVKVSSMPVGIAQEQYSIKVGIYTDGKSISNPEVKLTVQEG